jgi:hypothetical protein
VKRALVVIAVLLALAGAGLWYFLQSLDHLVKAAIERYGPAIAGVAVTVDSVRLSARDGRGTLRGVEIGNPAGFTAPRALRLDEITVAVDPASLAADVVVIHDILVQAPQVTYEARGGTTNLEAIQRNIEAAVQRTGEAKSGGKTAGGAGERRYRIGRVTLRGARVTLRSPVPGTGDIEIALPDVEVRDLGAREGGVTAAQAARAVNAALISRIAQKLLTNIDLLRRGGAQGALDALRGLIR